jgi:putative heme iron utilization protein
MTTPELDNGRVIRGLMRACTRVGLGTLAAPGGDPYVSLAMVAVDHDAAPLLYLSDLADHTRNLKVDPRVSLLFDGTGSSTVPLAGERATVQGRIERTTDPRLLARYVAHHPDAAAYIGFRDFNLYRVAVDRAHLVAGFGRIHWVDGTAVMLGASALGTLPEREADVLAHMNRDHGDAVQLYANRLLSRSGGGWVLTGVDPEGCDLRQGGETARLWFGQTVHDAEGARVELVCLVRRARSEVASA